MARHRTRTVTPVDLERLTEFEDLFGRRYESLALICLLAEGPMRWTDIAQAMDRRSKVRVRDTYVTRSLSQLAEDRLVKTVAENGEQLRTLTPRGVAKAERILWVFTAVDKALGDPGP